MTGLIHVAYIISALLFILSLAGLSKQETAKLGCTSGIIGMTIALIATLVNVNTGIGWGIIVVAVIIGAGIGLYLAKKVEMTQMPELIACLHSFVGLAAVLVGFNSFIKLGADPAAVASCAVPFEGSTQEVLEKVAQCKEQAVSALAHPQMTLAMFNTELVEIFLGIFMGSLIPAHTGSGLPKSAHWMSFRRSPMRLEIGFPASDSPEFIRSEHFMLTKAGIM